MCGQYKGKYELCVAIWDDFEFYTTYMYIARCDVIYYTMNIYIYLSHAIPKNTHIKQYFQGHVIQKDKDHLASKRLAIQYNMYS